MTKLGHRQSVPIHRDLVLILENVLRIQAFGTDKVFLIGGKPPHRSSLKRPWAKAVKVLDMERRPRFHDLRHTWKTNARRSGMHPEIQESILGHATRQRSVSERYGRISDQELLAAIDLMTFDHGETEILIARERPEKNDNQMITKGGPPKKKATGSGG